MNVSVRCLFGLTAAIAIQISVQTPSFAETTPENSAPVAHDDSVTTTAAGAIAISPLANDVDPDGDPLTIVAVDDPVGGSVTYTASQVTFKPGRYFTGTESFNYAISDGHGHTAVGRIQVVQSFVLAQGRYVGPIVTADNTAVGGIRGTVTQRGHFSFFIGVRGIAYPVHGVFKSDGSFVTTIKDPDRPAATISIQTTPDGKGANLISGSLQFRNETLTFSTKLITRDGTGGFEGAYTVLLPPDPNSLIPDAYGFARTVVTSVGSVLTRGRFADGRTFSSGSILDSDFSAFTYGTNRTRFSSYITGRVYFRATATSDFDGQWTWQFLPKGPGRNPKYVGSTITTSPVGSRYAPASDRAIGLRFVQPAPRKADYNVTDDRLKAAFAGILTVNTPTVVSAERTTPGRPALQFDTRTGLFRGSFIHPSYRYRRVTFQGVAFQKTNIGAAVFTLAGNPGSFLIKPR